MSVLGFFKENRIQAVLLFVWFFGLNTIANLWKSDFEKSRQENLLQRGQPNSPGNLVPRYDLSTGEDTINFLKYIPDARRQRLIILSGMSQMYAINDQKDMDLTISECMDDQLSAHGTRVFGLAAPNICNEEVLMLLLAVTEKPETKPAVFIYGLCFDKFRNVDLRPGYKSILNMQPKIGGRWRKLAVEYRDKYPKAADKILATLNALKDEGTEAGGQVEMAIRRSLSNFIPIIGAREELNAWFQLRLYLLRNKVLKIKPTSKRPQIPSRYQMNKEFLGLFLEEAKRQGVLPILYIVPLNPLAINPYVPEEYADFKLWAKALCEEHHVPFDNLESEVPADNWGEFLGGPDYKHFRGEGHRRTAMELVRSFRNYMIQE